MLLVDFCLAIQGVGNHGFCSGRVPKQGSQRPHKVSPQTFQCCVFVNMCALYVFICGL